MKWKNCALFTQNVEIWGIHSVCILYEVSLFYNIILWEYYNHWIVIKGRQELCDPSGIRIFSTVSIMLCFKFPFNIFTLLQMQNSAIPVVQRRSCNISCNIFYLILIIRWTPCTKTSALYLKVSEQSVD